MKNLCYYLLFILFPISWASYGYDEDFESFLQERRGDYYDDVVDQLLDEALEPRYYYRDEAAEKCLPKPEFRFSIKEADYILDKVTLMVQFFTRYVDQLIADGLYGMRVAQGILQEIAKQLNRDHPLFGKVEVLIKLINKVCSFAFKNMMERNAKYDVTFRKMLRKPHTFFRPWTRLHALKGLIEKGTMGITNQGWFTEKKSDHCLGLLLGTAPESNGRTCVVTEECIAMEKKPGTKGYVLTHQFMYFMIGASSGCSKQMISSLDGNGKTLQTIYNKFAANIASEMLSTKVTADTLDIVVEQGLFCSILGIAECNNKNRVGKILSFVTKEGCARVEDYVAHDTNIIEKRQDKNIGGCSQHTGAILAAYLASSLRFVLTPPPCELLQ